MSDIEIRRMETTDIEEVYHLERESFSKPWSRQGFWDALTGGNATFLVACTEGRIVGYCGMYHAMDQGEITNVAVGEAFRKRGIGQRLLEHLFTEAGRIGIKDVFLEVRVSNKEAIRLYEKMGFTLQGVRRGFYESPREDGYVMIRSQ